MKVWYTVRVLIPAEHSPTGKDFWIEPPGCMETDGLGKATVLARKLRQEGKQVRMLRCTEEQIQIPELT